MTPSLLDEYLRLTSGGADRHKFEAIGFGLDDLECLRADRSSGSSKRDTGR